MMTSSRYSPTGQGLVRWLLLLMSISCRKEETVPAASTLASATPGGNAAVEAFPVPSGSQAYLGKTGTVVGKIFYKGPSPEPAYLQGVPKGCEPSAQATYGRTFRVGPAGELADALVAVTGYSGVVFPADAAVHTSIASCAMSSRTVAMMIGQRLELANTDARETYLPVLKGTGIGRFQVAMPGGDPVKFYPQTEGRYELVDEMGKNYIKAFVYVLKFPTSAVTNVAGEFRIAGVPLGKAKLSAMLPQLNRGTEISIDVVEGEQKVDLTLEVSAEVAPSASGSNRAHHEVFREAPAAAKPSL